MGYSHFGKTICKLTIKLVHIYLPQAPSYNPSYSRGRDQEDHGSKPAWANSSLDLISKKPSPKSRIGGVARGVGPEFKPQYHTHKKETNKEGWGVAQ
jgi:hypothetical protein